MHDIFLAYPSTRDSGKTTDSKDSEIIYKTFNFQLSVKLEKGEHIEVSLIGLHVDNLVQVPI